MKVSQAIKKSVLVPIIFFSWFRFPLTLSELKRYAWQREIDEIELKAAINELPKISRVGELVWQGDLSIGERLERIALADRLWDKVNNWRWLFGYMPFLAQVYVTNTLAYNNAHANSDIDLLVVAQPERLWTTRACLLVMMNLFKLRVRSPQRWGKFSPEFFLSTRSLNINKLAIEKDYYLTYWLADLVPIWPDGEHRSLRQANQWVKSVLPGAWRNPKLRRLKYLKPSVLRRLIEKILSGKWGDQFEEWAYTKQRRIIDKNIRRLGTNPSVLYNRDIIKLHFNDRRAQVRDVIEQALDDLLAKNK
ncbi:MAG: hypothetical protein WC805_02270 [Patescibacteria group bacterium]|jgi:hypothetical protein